MRNSADNPDARNNETIDRPELSERLLSKLRIEIPGYTLLDKIGIGGQATVYKARELTSGLTVAIKVLNGGIHADAGARERLLREASALRALNHPNIVCVIEAGRTALGLDFIVMNYVDGRPLDVLWKDPAFAASIAPEPPERLRLFKRICDVVQTAHLKGITHRDLSPSNILITTDGEPHVLDFGLASTAFDDLISPSGRNVTVTGQFIGKVKYASPEQARGDRDTIDIRTDVYALGVILYQILTDGAFPYQVVGALVDVLNNIIHTQPIPPSATLRERLTETTKTVRQKNPRLVNETIEAVVLKALEKNPAERYQSAGELAGDVEQYLAGRPTTAVIRRPPGDRPSQSRRWLLPAFTSVSAFLLAGILVGLWFRAKSNAAAPMAPPLAGHPATTAVAFVPPALATTKPISSVAQVTPATQPVGPPGQIGDTFTNSIGMKLAFIPAGSFVMGSPVGEKGRSRNETQHNVTLTRSFLMGKTAVTQSQWQAVMGDNPSHFVGSDLPVDNVAWDEAVNFCKKLTATEGRRYRLPTEAEWEFACRAGTTTVYNIGDDDSALDAAAWGYENSGGKSHPVRTKVPNAWGLYDMHGNIFQWCSDWFGDYPRGDTVDPQGPDIGAERVLRGGSWCGNVVFLRSAGRHSDDPDKSTWGTWVDKGFRVVMELDNGRMPAVPPPPAPTTTATEIAPVLMPKKLGETFTNSIGMKLAFIPAGTFMMGSPTDEPGRSGNEKQHKVTLSRHFLMGTTAVTQGQWTAVMGNNPSKFLGMDLPVEQVAWGDAVNFCTKLGTTEARHYRLPTEAEWEYACRAGTTTVYNFGDDPSAINAAAWTVDNSHWRSHPVAGKAPNAWGLYDMHGDVFQWCSDWIDDYPDTDVTDPQGPDQGTGRVIRGGSWRGNDSYLRSAGRRGVDPQYLWADIGFRVVMELDPQTNPPTDRTADRGTGEDRLGQRLSAINRQLDAVRRPDPDRVPFPTGDPIEGPVEWPAKPDRYFLKSEQQIGNRMNNGHTIDREFRGQVTADAGFCLEGGHITMSSGTLEFAGTPDRPCVLIGVTFDCEETGSVRASNTIFENCSFDKTGRRQWAGGFNARWIFQNCLIHHSSVNSFKADQTGVKWTESEFVDCKLGRRHLWKQGGDSAAVAAAEWSTISQCDFYNCEFAPSAVWSMDRCNCYKCSINSGDGPDPYNSETNTLVQLGLEPGDETLVDALRAGTSFGSTGAVTYEAVKCVDRPNQHPDSATPQAPARR